MNAYGPDHPDVACNLNNLARLLEDTKTGWGRPSRCTAASWRSTSGCTAPMISVSPSYLENLAGLLNAHEPAEGGRAAVPPRVGDQGEGARPR